MDAGVKLEIYNKLYIIFNKIENETDNPQLLKNLLDIRIIVNDLLIKL